MVFTCSVSQYVSVKTRILESIHSRTPVQNYSCEDGMENPSLAITVCHHSASLVMPIGDPRDGSFYPPSHS